MKDVFPFKAPETLPKHWAPVTNPLWESMNAPKELYGTFRRTCGLTVAITTQKENDGKFWTHVSISRPTRLPNYHDMCEVKSVFLGDDALALQLFVPKSEHVNIHPYCLHLWSCLDGRPTPDFTQGLGTI